MLSLTLLAGAWSEVKAQDETDITTLPWVQKAQSCTQDFNNENGGTVFGTDAGGTNISYVDVSDYGIIKLYGTAGQRARLFINREEAGDNGIFFVDLNAEGVATFDCNTVLTQQPKAQYIHLNGVKASAWNTKLNLSKITVSGTAITFPEPDPFVLPDGEVEINDLPWVNEGQGCTNNLGSKTTSPIYGTDAGPADGKLSYVDATNYSAVKLYGPDGTVRLFINRAEFAGGTFQFYVTIADGVGTLNFSDVFSAQEGATYIHINGVKASAPGAEAQVDHITLVEKPFEFPEGVTDLTTLPYVNEAQGCVNNLGTSTDATIYGTDAGPADGKLSYIDVTNYSAVKLYGAKGDVVRLFINRAEYASGTFQFFVTIGEDGVGTLNLADVYSAQTGANYVHINGLKAAQTWAATPDADGKALVKYIGVVNAISVADGTAPYNYVLTGSGELTVPATRALADKNATAIDATGITAATALATANPNCLIKANAGMVTNTKNVIVDGVCATLELTDGMPFEAPEAFTATAASFSKTVDDAAKYATMVIPFAAALPSGVEAYNITGVSGTAVTATDAAAIAANKPVLLKNAGTFEFTAADADIAAVSGEQTNGILRGVYQNTDITVDAANYVLQNQGGTVAFYQSSASMPAIKPFRAYLSAAGGAKVLNLQFGETTGINDASRLMESAKENVVFNLNGQRIAAPQKGINIINGRKVIKK